MVGERVRDWVGYGEGMIGRESDIEGKGMDEREIEME